MAMDALTDRMILRAIALANMAVEEATPKVAYLDANTRTQLAVAQVTATATIFVGLARAELAAQLEALQEKYDVGT